MSKAQTDIQRKLRFHKINVPSSSDGKHPANFMKWKLFVRGGRGIEKREPVPVRGFPGNPAPIILVPF